MTITPIGFGAQVVGQAGDTLSPAYHGGYTAVADDVAVIFVAGRPGDGPAADPTTPTNWAKTTVSNNTTDSPDDRCFAYVKVLTASEALPSIASFAAGWTIVTAQVGIWRGVDITTPQDATAVASAPANGATATPTGITTATVNAMVISFVGTGFNHALGLLAGSQNGYTARMSGASYDTTTPNPFSVGVADRLFTGAAGAKTCPTWEQTINSGDAWVALTMALRERLDPPAAPTIFFQNGGHERAGLEWTAGSDGGSPVTSWDIDHATAAAPTTWLGPTNTGSTNLYGAVTGLTNGTAYVFRVRGVNAIGNGTWSATSGSATPADVRGFFLLESGDKFLLENGDKFLLESGAGSGAQTQTLTGSITGTGVLAKSDSKPVAGTSTGVGALSRAPAKALAGSSTGTGSLIRSITKILTGSSTPTGALTALRTITKSLAGSITPTGALLRAVSSVLAGSSTGAGAIRKLTSKGPVYSASLADTILALGPAGYWKLDEPSGTNADDSTANNRDGTYSGTVTLGGVTGPDGVNYSSFGGGKVTIADNNDWSVAATGHGLTLFCLVRPTSIPGAAELIGKTAPGVDEWQMVFAPTASLVGVIYTAAQVNTNSRSVSSVITLDQWQALAQTMPINGQTIVLKLNRNGTNLVGTTSGPSGAGITNNAQPVTVGLGIAGAIGHVAMFAREMSDADMVTLMTAANAWIAGAVQGDVSGIGGRIAATGSLSMFRVFVLALGGSVTSVGAFIKAISKAAAGSTTPEGDPNNLTAKGLQGSTTPSGSLSMIRVAFQLLTGAITGVGALVKMVGKATVGSTTPEGDPNSLTAKGLGGTTAPTGTLSMSSIGMLVLSGVISAVGAIAKAVTKTASGTVPLEGDPNQSIAKTLGGSTTPAGSLSFASALTLLLSGSITATGTLARSIAKRIEGAIVTTGTLAKFVGKLLGGVITGSGSLVTEGGVPTEPGEICAYVDVGVIDAYVDCPQMQAYVDVGIIDATVG